MIVELDELTGVEHLLTVDTQTVLIREVDVYLALNVGQFLRILPCSV